MTAIPSHDMFTDAILAETLGGRRFLFLPQVGSTNTAAREWAAADPGLPSGAVVIADEQTAGRGRLNRQWYTPPGQALALSVILRPDLPASRLQRLTMLGGAATAETLNSLVPNHVYLKWPNDVLLAGRKVGGILTEAVWLGDQLQAAIIGIGVNVRVDFGGTDLAETATSLETHTQTPISRLRLLTDLLSQMDFWYARLSKPTLVNNWRGWLKTLGQRVSVHTKHGILTGLAQDVDEGGALLLVDSEGCEHRILVGDVQESGVRPDPS